MTKSLMRPWDAGLKKLGSSLQVRLYLCVQTSEAERIGVNQVARVLPSGNDSGSEQR
jgi:hypothetical protein